MSSLIDQCHFQTGMGELVSFAQSLLESHTDHHAIKRVQRHIERAFWEMQAALEEANGKLENIDNQTMVLVVKKKKLEDERNQQNQRLCSFRDELASYKSSVGNSRVKLHYAQCDLEKKNRDLEDKKHGVDLMQLARLNGIAVMVFGSLLCPPVGLTAGTLLVGGCQLALNDAKKRKKKAEEIVQHCEKDLSQLKAESSRLSSLVQKAENDIARIEESLQSIISQQHLLASCQAEIICVQNVLRKCVHFLGMLAGKVSMANVLCMDILIYEQLENVLEDILQYVYPLLGHGNQGGVMALSSYEVKKFILKLKSARECLRALTYVQDFNAISYFA